MGGFAWIGAVMPWKEFHQPEITGITWPVLLGLSFAVLFFRRIPAIFMAYKLLPRTIANWSEALFAGYFGPIGIGAVFYLEHTKHLIPHDHGDPEERALLGAMVPVVYFLVLFSIVIHGISIPILSLYYKWIGKEELRDDDDAVTIRPRSIYEQPPVNAISRRGSIVAYNRFSRPRDLEFEAETEDWKSTYAFESDDEDGSNVDNNDDDPFPIHLHGIKSEELQEGPQKRRRKKDEEVAKWRGHAYSKSQPDIAHIDPAYRAEWRRGQDAWRRSLGMPRQNTTDTCICSRSSTFDRRDSRTAVKQSWSRAASKSRSRSASKTRSPNLSRSATLKTGRSLEIDSLDGAVKNSRQLALQREMGWNMSPGCESPQREVDPIDLAERVKALQQQRQTSFDLGPKGDAEMDVLDEKLKD